MTLAVLCLGGSPALADDGVFTVGRVTPNPQRHIKDLRRLAEYVATRMQDLGVREGRVLMARDNRQMKRMLVRQQVDWLSESVISALQFERETGARVLLKRWKKGVPYYHSVIFVRTDSGIRGLQDLVDRRIAFEDPGSSTAFFLPFAELRGAGLSLEWLYSPRETPLPGEVGYVFSRAEINSATWVHKGIVDAAAFSNLDWGRGTSMPDAFVDDVMVIHESSPVPRSLELVRAGLDKVRVKRLRKLLLHMHEDPEGRETLRRYQDTSRYETLSPTDVERLDTLRGSLPEFETYR